MNKVASTRQRLMRIVFVCSFLPFLMAMGPAKNRVAPANLETNFERANEVIIPPQRPNVRVHRSTTIDIEGSIDVESIDDADDGVQARPSVEVVSTRTVGHVPVPYSVLHSQLVNAVRSRNLDLVRELLRSIPTDEISSLINTKIRDNDDKTLLHLASSAGNSRMMAFLIYYGGANIDALDVTMSTPLHVAAGSCSEIAVELLLRIGANVNARSVCNNTPLHRAAFLGCPRVLELLLISGADVNAKNDDGKSAFLETIRFGQIEAARCLLKYGADVNEKDTNGLTIYQYFRKIGHKHKPTLDFLIRHGSR